MNSDQGNFPVVHNESKQRFEIAQDGILAELDYRIVHGTMVLTHTGVPPEKEGKGTGGALARAALEYAKAQKIKVKVLCPFVRKWMERHPEYAGMVE